MELTKIQYKKLKKLMPTARKPAKISNYKFMCAMFYIIENGCKWRALLKKYGTIAKILAATKKQKLFNKGNSVLFIDGTSIKVSPDANRS